MEDKFYNNQCYSQQKIRMKAFQKIKYYPQLMSTEERSLFYTMKDLEIKTELTEQQKKMYSKLQKLFKCEP